MTRDTFLILENARWITTVFAHEYDEIQTERASWASKSRVKMLNITLHLIFRYGWPKAITHQDPAFDIHRYYYALSLKPWYCTYFTFARILRVWINLCFSVRNVETSEISENIVVGLSVHQESDVPSHERYRTDPSQVRIIIMAVTLEKRMWKLDWDCMKTKLKNIASNQSNPQSIISRVIEWLTSIFVNSHKQTQRSKVQLFRR